MSSENLMYSASSTGSLSTPVSFQTQLNQIMIWFGLALAVLLVVKFIFICLEDGLLARKVDRKSLKRMKELAIKQKLEAELMSHSKITSRYKYQQLANQAGVTLSLGEFRLICLLCALTLPFFSYFFMKNIYLSLALIGVGWMIPGQILTSIRHRRVNLLDRQVESFMELFVERYKLTQSPSIALEGCAQDMAGQQPLYSELQRALSEMDTGDPVLEVFQRFSERTGNKYLIRMSASLKMAEDIGTSDARELLLTKALNQYRQNKTLRNVLKERIEGPKRESMILLVAVPMVIIYQVFCSPGYVDFMIGHKTGKIGCVVILLSCMGCTWFINKKIGAPID